jgi:hypothetical protein
MDTQTAEIIVPQTQALAQLPQSGLEITVASALETQMRASIEARYALAIRQPRDLDAMRLRLLKECKRPRFAEVARYAKPQGKKKDPKTGEWVDNYLEGPSIRFVEAALRCMTNVYPETTVIYDDAERRVMRVAVTDLEANVTYSQDVTIAKHVERSSADGREVISSRKNKKNKMVYIVEATDDEVLNKQNSLLSKTLRTLGLRVLPGDIVDEAQEEVIATQHSADKTDPDAQRKRVFDSFAEIGISPDEIKLYFGREVGPADLPKMRALFQALRAGDANWHDVMEEKRAGEAGAASKGLEEKLRQKAATPSAPQAEAPKANSGPSHAAAVAVPVVGPDGSAQVDLGPWKIALKDATDLTSVDQVKTQALAQLPQSAHAEFTRLYMVRCDEVRHPRKA